MTLNEFNTQLDSLEANLIKYYKQKVLLVSLRENLRFQYVTALKAKWFALEGDMNQQAYMQGTSGAVILFGMLMHHIQKTIPMTDTQGNPVDGWMTQPGNPGNGGGVPHAGFLDPIENLITKPFYGPTNANQKPAYLAYGIGPGTIYGQSAEQILANHFGVSGPGAYVINRVGTIANQRIYFDMPMPSMDWIISYLYGGANMPNDLAASYEVAKNMMSGTYANGTLVGIYQQFKDMMTQIIFKTQLIMNLQLQINQSEQDISDFVGAFSAFGATLNVAQILLDLQALAEAAANPPPPPPEPEPVIVSTITPAVVVEDIPVIVAAPKSKLPWIAAAAVAGIFLLGNKK